MCYIFIYLDPQPRPILHNHLKLHHWEQQNRLYRLLINMLVQLFYATLDPSAICGFNYDTGKAFSFWSVPVAIGETHFVNRLIQIGTCDCELFRHNKNKHCFWILQSSRKCVCPCKNMFSVCLSISAIPHTRPHTSTKSHSSLFLAVFWCCCWTCGNLEIFIKSTPPTVITSQHSIHRIIHTFVGRSGYGTDAKNYKI